MIPPTKLQHTAEAVDSYMQRYRPRLAWLGSTVQNITKRVRDEAKAARQLMKEPTCSN